MPSKRMPNESARLRSLWKKPERRLKFKIHALHEMAKDEIIEAHVRRVLEYGSVTWIETKTDVLWHVEGRDLDGRSIRLVVAVDEDQLIIKIITAMILG